MVSWWEGDRLSSEGQFVKVSSSDTGVSLNGSGEAEGAMAELANLIPSLVGPCSSCSLSLGEANLLRGPDWALDTIPN